MKSIELARLKNFVLMQQKGRTSTLTKFVKGKVYVVSDQEAELLLSKTTGRDVPVFKMSKNVTDAVRPVEKEVKKRTRRTKAEIAKAQEVGIEDGQDGAVEV